MGCYLSDINFFLFGIKWRSTNLEIMIHDGWKGKLWPAIKYRDMTAESRNCVTKKEAAVAMQRRGKHSSVATSKTHQQISHRNHDFSVVQAKAIYIEDTNQVDSEREWESVEGSQSRQTVKYGHESRRTRNQNHCAGEAQQ
jgi:hypothetical protein